MRKVLLSLFLILSVLLTGCTEILFPNTVEVEPDIVEIQNDITEVYEKVSYGCVGIYATNKAGGASVGSGVVYKESNGTYYVVTNNHVIDKMTDITDKSITTATAVIADHCQDLFDILVNISKNSNVGV